MKPYTSVDAYLLEETAWQEELVLLRELFRDTGLEECLKWGRPTYTLDGKNVAGFSAFKHWVAIWFFQGVFLKDPEQKLISANEGHTKGLRQWRFSSAEEIREAAGSIMAYLREATENQRAGKTIAPNRNTAVLIPDELQEAFEQNPALGKAFRAFTPGRQREFAAYVALAKQENTRLRRLDKIIPLIMEGAGLNDKYRKGS